MPVKKDPSGRRSVAAEVEVPGTPEEVWHAIATGPGISSWFFPARVDEHVEGSLKLMIGPGMDAAARITHWDPPHLLVLDESGNLGPDAPDFATEWIVEARAGGTCLVRVVHTWFATTDEWDEQFEGQEGGWRACFEGLRLYLTHFHGQTSSAFLFMEFLQAPKADVWSSLLTKLGGAGAKIGQRLRSAPGAPAFAGIVEHTRHSQDLDELLIRIDEPAPGFIYLFGLSKSGQTILPLRVYLFGAQAKEIAQRDEPIWRAWLNQHLPLSSTPK